MVECKQAANPPLPDRAELLLLGQQVRAAPVHPGRPRGVPLGGHQLPREISFINRVAERRTAWRLGSGNAFNDKHFLVGGRNNK